MGKCKITFQPGGSEATVAEGTDLLTAAIAAGVQLHSDCGGEGICSGCKVVIREGEVASEFVERLTASEREAGFVLACRTTVRSDVQVEVPPGSRVEREQILTETEREQILTEAAKIEQLIQFPDRIEEAEKAGELAPASSPTRLPLVAKLFLELPPPTATDNISDLERLYREIRRGRDISLMQTGLANVRKLARLLRENDWKITVTLGQRNGTTEVVLIEPGDTTQRHYGIVVDIGTTTIVASLVDLNSRRVLGTKGTRNRQGGYGEDVITRIIYAGMEEGLEDLHRVVIDTVNELIAALVSENEISLNDVTAVMCAGNTTMTHLLLRIDPSYIRRSPYVPAINTPSVIRAQEAGIRINPRGLLSCLPSVSSYVGGDITAG
ncbi:MAG: 2Fe-2S iron-sulfur cluster binding domain-containing protein, partial [Gemmatimonadetes bacterium]|nr:2Fe-2S iron-sulfur cluster binding domain-containing protein [Gemmatimonadota bacterium]